MSGAGVATDSMIWGEGWWHDGRISWQICLWSGRDKTGGSYYTGNMVLQIEASNNMVR